MLDLLADGSLHLTAVSLLRPHLTDENHRELLDAARHRTKREVEEIVARVRPQPPVPPTVRKLPARTLPSAPPSAPVDAGRLLAPVTSDLEREADRGTSHAAPPKRLEIKPLAPEQYKVQFTASRETYEKLREAQDLLRHRIPGGDVAAIFDRALTLLLTELHKTKHAAVDRPREGHRPANRSRYIPVWLSSARRSTRRRWLTSNGSHPNQGGGGFVGLMEVERRYVTVTQRAGKRGEGSRSLSSFLFIRDALVYCMLKN